MHTMYSFIIIISFCVGQSECQDGITNECTQLCSLDNETMNYICNCSNGYVVNTDDPNICDGTSLTLFYV